MLFDTAEKLFDLGRREAAALLYESVSEGEKYQHSERLAICQYRLFVIALGDSQDVNLRAANQFEPFVERLNEIDQLDAIKQLANVFSSLRVWDKADELAERLGRKAEIQYTFWKKDNSQKQPERPVIFYMFHSFLVRSFVCDERGDYQFTEWGTANTYLYRLMAGHVEVLSEYVNYVALRENEIFPALFKIMQAANRLSPHFFMSKKESHRKKSLCRETPIINSICCRRNYKYSPPTPKP